MDKKPTQEHITYVTNGLNLGFLPVLKSLYKIFAQPTNDTNEFKNWEEAWNEAILYFKDTYCHRIGTDKVEECITYLFDNKLI